MSDVFISYSRKNSTFARRLIDCLSLANKDAWVDWEGIPLTAPNWWSEIKAGIEGADSFVFILSPDSMASVVCNMELDYAIELHKRIVPVVYMDVVTRDAFASLADFTPDAAMEERLNGKDVLTIARDNWQRLSHINWVFFRETDDFDAAFETLVKTVETDLEYVKAHTRYLIRAQEWVNENWRADLLIFGSEIDRAEAWLQKGEGYAAAATGPEKVQVVNPLPDELHREYIRASRQADTRRRRLVRSAQLSIAVLVVVLIAGFGIGSLIVTQTQQKVTDSQATVTQAAIVVQIIGGLANTMLRQQDDPAARIASMDVLVQRYPDQSLAWQSRGLVYAELGNAVQSVADFTEAIRLNPGNADLYNNRGGARADLGLGNMREAIADFDESIRLNPFNFEVYFNRGIAKGNLGDMRGAITDYDEAIRLNPEYAAAYNNRGATKRVLGDLETAIVDFNEAIRLNPEYAAAYNNRGVTKQDLGDLDGAIVDFDAAIYRDPKYAKAYHNRGNAKRVLGDLEAAIMDFDEAIRLNPASVFDYFNRGNSHYTRVQDGESDSPKSDSMQALSDWRKAEQLGYILPQDVLDAIAEIEAELGITPTPAP
jgi:tetratricopeptide (TPR) repeat protein